MNPADAPLCLHCGEPVLEGEQDTYYDQPFHMECGLRSMMGGLNHMLGKCSCCGGTEPPDPPGMTRREAARAAYSYWKAAQREKKMDIIKGPDSGEQC